MEGGQVTALLRDTDFLIFFIFLAAVHGTPSSIDSTVFTLLRRQKNPI